ncbi:winged helix-turn-helix domain-containing protein [Poseidonocella sp. HB161398]|uniref:winged helix-turn-helix domain-containing protein n=1 Tax=Poseidonocella sp. HB161398 TaxID=2320855 RepID=UPI0021029A0F|nr:winged helix-turn-helix domain-containing protein [Poseidonocella sp. HB161398]
MLGRRRAGRARNAVEADGFRYDRAARRLELGGTEVVLQARELQLLEILLDNLGRILTKEELADRLYTFEEAPSLNGMEQFVARLRRKTAGGPLAIRTFRGLGCMAVFDEQPRAGLALRPALCGTRHRAGDYSRAAPSAFLDPGRNAGRPDL